MRPIRPSDIPLSRAEAILGIALRVVRSAIATLLTATLLFAMILVATSIWFALSIGIGALLVLVGLTTGPFAWLGGALAAVWLVGGIVFSAFATVRLTKRLRWARDLISLD